MLQIAQVHLKSIMLTNQHDSALSIVLNLIIPIFQIKLAYYNVQTTTMLRIQHDLVKLLVLLHLMLIVQPIDVFKYVLKIQNYMLIIMFVNPHVLILTSKIFQRGLVWQNVLWCLFFLPMIVQILVWKIALLPQIISLIMWQENVLQLAIRIVRMLLLPKLQQERAFLTVQLKNQRMLIHQPELVNPHVHLLTIDRI